MTVRVVLAEDNLIAREGVTRVLERSEDIELVATCADAATLRATIDETHPDVVLTDIRMPPDHTDEGIRAAVAIRASHPEIGMVVLSQHTDPAYVLALLDSGTDRRSYLLKDRVHKRGELVSAIHTVAEGGSVIDPKVVEVLVEERMRAARSPLTELTERELEVLSQIATGKSNSAIAESLVLTKRAVEKHINAIFMKLGLAAADDVSKRVKSALMFLADDRPPARH